MMKILYDGITISSIEDYFVLNINMAVLWPQVAGFFFFYWQQKLVGLTEASHDFSN